MICAVSPSHGGYRCVPAVRDLPLFAALGGLSEPGAIDSPPAGASHQVGAAALRGSDRRQPDRGLPGLNTLLGAAASFDRGASWSFRNCQPALHRGAGESALEPRGHVLQGVELDKVAGAIKPDQVAYPAQHGDVGDGVVIVHDPLPAVEARLQHSEQAFGLVAIALKRAFVGDLAAGELVEVAEDRKSTRLNSSHLGISYAVFCLKK